MFKKFCKYYCRFGGKIECPVCLKCMSFSQCFNVYLDATQAPKGVNPESVCMFEQLETLDRENSQIHQAILKDRKVLAESTAIQTEIRTQIHRVE